MSIASKRLVSGSVKNCINVDTGAAESEPFIVKPQLFSIKLGPFNVKLQPFSVKQPFNVKLQLFNVKQQPFIVKLQPFCVKLQQIPLCQLDTLSIVWVARQSFADNISVIDALHVHNVSASNAHVQFWRWCSDRCL